MPRNRIRTTNKASWTAETLRVAVHRCRQGVSIHKVAKETSIPYSTLQKKTKLDEANLRSPKLGRFTIFSAEQESALADRILHLSNMFHGLTVQQLRKIAFNCAETMGLRHNFNAENKMASRDWIQGFLKRNPRVSVRKPEAISIQRITGFNKTEVDKFFKNLEEVISKAPFTPQDVYNMDETGITTVQDTDKILAKKGQKRVGSVTSWERGKTITVICCMNAAGSFVPPLFIYPRKRHSPQLEKDGPAGAVYCHSKNGWTTEDIFIKWLQHFAHIVKPLKDKPVLLVLDNHFSHATLEAYNFCRENFITMISIPPHTSHILQPLDVVFYGPLKKAYNKECNLYIKSHNLEKITPYEITGLFNKAYMRVASVEKGVSGFASTGIFPLDPHKMSEEDFIDKFSVRVEEPCSITDTEHHVVVYTPLIGSGTDPTPSTFGYNIQTTHERSDVTCDKQQNLTETRDTTKVIFDEIVNQQTPLPIIGGKKWKGKGIGKGKKQQSQILTSTPLKKIFEEKAKKRKEKERKDNKSVMKIKVEEAKKNLFHEAFAKKRAKRIKKSKQEASYSEGSTDEGVEEVTYAESGDSDIENLPINQKESDNQSICMISLEEGKSQEVWYRCRNCGGWAHEACSGCDDPSRYICDFCSKK